MGPLISLFLISGDISSGFQSQSGQPYLHLAEAYRFTSDATHADLLEATLAGKLISSMYLRAGIGGVRNRDLSCHRRTIYRLSYAGSVCRKRKNKLCGIVYILAHSRTYLWHSSAHDVLVLVLVDPTLVVVRLDRELHLLHHPLLSVRLLDKLQYRA